MRFEQEYMDGANAGLVEVMEILKPIKDKHEVSFSDLWVLASYIAIEEMGGLRIEFRFGRKDYGEEEKVTPNGRLPDASRNASHIREVFYRMGFSDREIVVLIGGGHAIGKCHKDRSGYEGPWTHSPLSFDNAFFTTLLQNQWSANAHL